ncbi:MAG: cation-translocating P-type ATPase [candidate division Zixibacteria bacterium]|nr:cation-translocating P-type ATPase [candidate division Zixibacteria bacterium]
MNDWYQMETSAVLQRLGVNAENGLSDTEVTERLTQHGANELIERGVKSPWLILWEQFTAVMVVVLIVAAVLSAVFGDYQDTIAILVIIVLNAILGFRQEYRAEKAMAALKKLAVPKVKVRRGGRVREISARELVPGDIVLLESGNLVPTDCRLLESVNLRTQEAALTGESEPIDKETVALVGDDLPLGDRYNLAYMGTVIAYGRGTAVVTETGMKTELGRIAGMIQSTERQPTPLQRRLDQLGKRLALAALVLVAIIFTEGIISGEEVRLMLITAVSVAVAAVPEGLPAVVTIALALGAQRMLKRRALIRKLPAVETLGSVTVICSDKTGTLTENRMTVTILDVAGHRVDLAEDLRRHAPVSGGATAERAIVSEHSQLALLLAGGALCNDAILEFDDKRPGQFNVVGEPTEGALVVAAARQDLWKKALTHAFPRQAEIPFDSTRKRMTTLHTLPDSQLQLPDALQKLWKERQEIFAGKYIAFTKGAIDSLLDISSHVWVNRESQPLDDTWRERIQAAHDQLAEDGMRVLAVAFRSLDKLPDLQSLENDLTLIGLIGMMDPARPEVREAVRTCKAAGIRPVMITGDHPLTARYIARELGIADTGRIMTGRELNQTGQELSEFVEEVPVFARVAPEHKLNIVAALQERGNLVAMTGDGVNDAPALKKADIGVAMGITGTDVSKEAADVVLQDDNFATIVAAVREGRVIYDNIRRFIIYLLAGNVGELAVMLVSPLLGMPLALLPIQILWINLVTDGLPALALGVEPPEKDTMKRPPYPPSENIFSRGAARQILWLGFIVGAASLLVGYLQWAKGYPQWQTMVFTTLTFSQMAHVMTIRSYRESAFRLNPLTNKPLMAAVSLTFILQLLVIYVPFLQPVFDTIPLSAADLLLCMVLGSAVFWAYEIEKFFLRRRERIK